MSTSCIYIDSYIALLILIIMSGFLHEEETPSWLLPPNMDRILPRSGVDGSDGSWERTGANEHCGCGAAATAAARGPLPPASLAHFTASGSIQFLLDNGPR